MDVARLTRPMPRDVPPSFALLGRATVAGLPVPAGGVLLAPDLGPVAEHELVDLRTSTRRDHPAEPLTVDEARGALPALWAHGEGLLLTRAVDGVHAGTAALRPGQVCDAVRAWEVTTDGLAAGGPPRVFDVPRLRRLARPHRGGDQWRTPLPPWGMRLSRLLRQVRPLADGGAVEWSDDGVRCWLLMVHPAGQATMLV